MDLDVEGSGSIFQVTGFDEKQVHQRRKWKVIRHNSANSHWPDVIIEADFAQITRAGHLAFFNLEPLSNAAFSDAKPRLVRAFAWYTEVELISPDPPEES